MKANEYNIRGKFRITDFENPSKATVHKVSGTKMDGTRVRENFKTHDEALARKQQLEVEATNDETAGRMVFTKLTPQQVNLAEAAFERLDEDAEMAGAVEWWITEGRSKALAVSPPLTQAITEFRTWLDSAGCSLRKDTKQNYKIRVDLFAKSRAAFGKRVHEITPDTIFGYLEKRDVSRETKNNDRRVLSRFFSWCMARPQGWI